MKGEEAVRQKLSGRERALSDYRAAAEECGEGGDTGLKIAILKKATELFSSLPDAHAAYADALIESSRQEASVLEKGDFFRAARLSWEKALAIDPFHAPSLLGKGRYLVMMAYRGGEDPAEGMQTLQKAIQSASDSKICAEGEFYVGMGYRRLGDEEAARRQFSKCLEAHPAFMPAVLASQAG